jgi:DNA-binding NtrC family response regulator
MAATNASLDLNAVLTAERPKIAEPLVHHRSDLQEPPLAENMVGASRAFLSSIVHLAEVARSHEPVLITGETGTGKELVARAIHNLSGRANSPFIPLNCGSLVDTLLEVELFGHERGAFTGAHRFHHGLLTQAARGTLFLDEIDTLPMKAQIDLLRVLQDRRFRPVGSTQEKRLEARLLGACNTSLTQLTSTGQFRADLYYRLCVFSIHLPPLRQRPEDIPVLAQHFLSKHLPPHKAGLRLSGEAEEYLMRCEWPGNIRELENTIIRAIQLAQGHTIDRRDLILPFEKSGPGDIVNGTPSVKNFRAMKREVLESFERTYLVRLMTEHRGNITLAARAAGKERRDLGRLLKKHQLDAKGFRSSSDPRSGFPNNILPVPNELLR